MSFLSTVLSTLQNLLVLKGSIFTLIRVDFEEIYGKSFENSLIRSVAPDFWNISFLSLTFGFREIAELKRVTWLKRISCNEGLFNPTDYSGGFSIIASLKTKIGYPSQRYMKMHGLCDKADYDLLRLRNSWVPEILVHSKHQLPAWLICTEFEPSVHVAF